MKAARGTPAASRRSAMYDGRRIFRAGWGMTLLFVALTALMGTGAVYTYRTNGWTWVSGGLAAAAVVLGLGSIIESLIMRVEITDDALLVTDLTGRRRYAISEIERVEESRGSPAAIRLTTGRWVKLPSVGSNMGNSIRAWLRQSGKASGSKA